MQRDSLEECRQKLLDILANYAGFQKDLEVIAVFDAHMVKDMPERRFDYCGVAVVYTKENESADNFIERFVYQNASQHSIRVATADYLEQTMILRCGGIRVTARELREEIKSAIRAIDEKIKPNKLNDKSLATRLHPELVEKLEKMRRSKF